jgi:hypothetical protein
MSESAPDEARQGGKESNRWYSILKDFQTSISAIIGFIGVITTLAVNAHLTRVQDAERERTAQATLQSALKQELVSIRVELDSIRDAAGNKSTASFEFTLESPYVYRALVKDLGILPPKKAQAVISVYRELHLTMNSIRGLSGDPTTPVVTIQSKRFPEAIEWVAHVHRELDQVIAMLD